MKLTLTLPDKPAFVHVLPLFDMLALLLVSVLLAPSFMAQAGVEVELPQTSGQLQRFEDPIIITATAGERPALFLNGETSSLATLTVDLAFLLENERWQPGDTALIKADAGLVVGVQNEILEIVRAAGLKPAISLRTATPAQ